jgi:Protein of unknown function (DUF1706)
MTKSEFLAKLQQTRAEWDSLISQVDPSRMTEPNVDGEYSIKDIIAHVMWYERENLGVIRQHVLVGSPHWDAPTQDDRNAAVYEDIRNLSTSEVLTQSKEIYQQQLAALKTLSDEDFTDVTRFKDMPSTWDSAHFLASNSYEHYEQHFPALRAWLAKP